MTSHRLASSTLSAAAAAAAAATVVMVFTDAQTATVGLQHSIRICVLYALFSHAVCVELGEYGAPELCQ